MSNSFTVTLDRTLDELTDAYRKHFKLPPETKVIKRDIHKLISAISEEAIDNMGLDGNDDGELDTRND
jgi:hypothetical protein